MAFIHGRYTQVWLNGFAASGALNESSVESEVDATEVTTFNNDDKAYIAGLGDATISLSGFLTTDTVHPEATFEALLEELKQTNFPTVVVPNGRNSIQGDLAWFFDGLLTSKSVSTAVDEAVTVEMEYQTSGGKKFGIVLVADTTETGDDESVDVDNTLSTSTGWSAILSVSDILGTSPELDVTIEHSPDGSTWGPLGSFSTVTTTGGFSITGTGTVERHVRASWTLGGTSPSATFNVVFARR